MSSSKNFDPNDYVMVSERIEAFKNDFPRRAIRTELLKDDGRVIVVKATIWPDVDQTECFFTGHAEEDRERGEVNASGAALENCETSAVGRALAFMGYPTARSGRKGGAEALSDPTRRKIMALCSGLRIDDAGRDELVAQQFGGAVINELTEPQGQAFIEALKGRCRRPAPASEVA